MKNPQAKIQKLVAKRRATRAAAEKKCAALQLKIDAVQRRIDKVVAPLYAKRELLDRQIRKIDDTAAHDEAALLRQTLAACAEAGINPVPYMRLDSAPAATATTS